MPSRRPAPPPARAAAAAIVAALSACASHQPGYDEPVPAPAAFAAPAESAAGPAAPDRWWRALRDPVLDDLQSRAISGNFNLAAARDRLRAARAVVRRERSFLFPTLDFSLFGEQTRRKSNSYSGEEQFGAAVTGAYDLDPWGRNDALAESAELSAAVQRERLEAAAIALSANVARTWYALVEQRGQASVLEAQIETNEKVLRVVRARFGGGVVRASDVLRQERLLESTREQRAAVTASIDTLEHALLVLLGETPTKDLDQRADRLPELPPRPALGLPSELLTRRPDVRAARLAIRAADADVAAAVADQYPSVAIALSASTAEETVADLFDDWASTLSVDVLGPLFDAGRREAEVDRAQAVKAERVSAYAQTILIAFRQVVDALSRESARNEQIEHLERQLQLAVRTSERLNREYLNGDISYIDVLDALTTEQQLQRDLLSARFQRIADRVDLYEALAGGWDAAAEAHAGEPDPHTSPQDSNS